jgi:hypothetical protein
MLRLVAAWLRKFRSLVAGTAKKRPIVNGPRRAIRPSVEVLEVILAPISAESFTITMLQGQIATTSLAGHVSDTPETPALEITTYPIDAYAVISGDELLIEPTSTFTGTLTLDYSATDSTESAVGSVTINVVDPYADYVGAVATADETYLAALAGAHSAENITEDLGFPDDLDAIDDLYDAYQSAIDAAENAVSLPEMFAVLAV